jgi:hypothetical protein
MQTRQRYEVTISVQTLVTSPSIWYFFYMAASKKSHALIPLALNQRQRRRPSRVKSKAFSRSTPEKNLQLACELSDLCFVLRKAALKHP